MSTITNNVAGFLSTVAIPVRLAATTESGWPVVVSLWYLVEDEKLYCATRQSAKIVTHLQNDSRCAFEVAADIPPYCGVRGQAEAAIDQERGAEILERLLIRYLGGTTSSLAQNLLSYRAEEVAIVIQPVNLFTWNFTERMRDSIEQSGIEKPCPR